MKPKPSAILMAIIVLLLGYIFFLLNNRPAPLTITTFEECASLYPVLEIYPRQCNTPDGKNFVEIVTIPTGPLPPTDSETVCTMDAKLCPDGSYVGRTGSSCEFAPCP